MPAYPVRAVVLRNTKLGETDTIVTLLTDAGTQVRAVAKGLRKPGSRFGGRLEPFSVVDLLLHTGRTLEIVTEARTVSTHQAVRADLDRSTAAATVADVLEKTTAEGEAEPVLFELAMASLVAIAEAPRRALPALVAAFLLKTMGILGLRPAIARCARCEGRVTRDAVFSAEAGGVLCATCAGCGSRAPVSVPARGALAALEGARMADVRALGLDPDAVDECLRHLRGFVEYHVPARLRSLEYLFRAFDAGEWPCVDPPGHVG